MKDDPRTGRVDPVILTRFLVRETMGTVMAGVALFWAAGTVAWPMGWVVAAIYAAWVAGMAAVLIVLEPELIAERLGPKKGGKSWDFVILALLGMANLARLIVAGLDRRYGWTPADTFSLPVMIAAAAVAAAGYGLFVWATASNAFFSQQVRLQEERGQSVATGGPYRFVRHPGYAGALLFEAFAPIALGSLWAVIPSIAGAVALVVRTSLEDRALRSELGGYAEYAGHTRFRLVPGIW
ncbi:MAG TPA: isoprenylcysteine carboxylmethyltransferase family protein [Coriobacteriia bacterium]